MKIFGLEIKRNKKKKETKPQKGSDLLKINLTIRRDQYETVFSYPNYGKIFGASLSRWVRKKIDEELSVSDNRSTTEPLIRIQ